MGTPMLQKKKELNYRRGNTMFHCGGCDHWVRDARWLWVDPVLKTMAELSGKEEPRCKLVGLEPGRAYRVNEHAICDESTNRDRLVSLMGDR